jgi:hypothetical protein
MSEDIRLAAKKLAEERERARTDKFFLANDVLGFDFQWETHAELFGCFIKYNSNKPWVEQDSIKDRMVLWSRGHFKTTAIVVEIIQAIINYPNIRILIMQGNVKVTQTLLKQIKAHFTGEASGSRFRELFSEFCGESKELGPSPSMQFTVPCRTQKQLAQATVTVASPRSVKTGQHYDMGFFDDLVNDQNFRSPKMLAKVTEDFTLAQPLIDPGGYRLVTGTRYAFGDLYETILRWQNQGNKWIVTVKDCWTDASAKLPDNEKKPRFPRFRKRNGELSGFTTDELLQMQSDDPANFACQYLNRPIHSSLQAFTEEMWEAVKIPAHETPALGDAILMIDLASSEGAKADDSVIQVGRLDNMGVVYLCDQRGGQWQPIELALNIIDVALRHRPTKICLENTASCKYFVDFLRMVAQQRNVYLPLELVRVDNQPEAKKVRIFALANMLKRQRFKVLAGLPKYDKLVEQACEYPRGKHFHDDYIDTASLLFRELTQDILNLPVRRPAKHPILALIADRENALVKTLTEDELQQVSASDLTGFE